MKKIVLVFIGIILSLSLFSQVTFDVIDIKKGKLSLADSSFLGAVTVKEKSFNLSPNNRFKFMDGRGRLICKVKSYTVSSFAYNYGKKEDYVENLYSIDFLYSKKFGLIKHDNKVLSGKIYLGYDKVTGDYAYVITYDLLNYSK